MRGNGGGHDLACLGQEPRHRRVAAEPCDGAYRIRRFEIFRQLHQWSCHDRARRIRVPRGLLPASRLGAMLQVEATAQDAYASFNLAAERVESRLRRHKGNLRRHKLKMRDRMANRVAAASADDRPLAAPAAVGEDMVGSQPVVIAESLDGLKEMSVSHAVKELDVTRGHVVVFRHSGDGRPNIVYRRSDGNIGWIDPALSPKA